MNLEMNEKKASLNFNKTRHLTSTQIPKTFRFSFISSSNDNTDDNKRNIPKLPRLILLVTKRFPLLK